MSRLAVPSALVFAFLLAGCAERLAVTPVANEAAMRIEADLRHACAGETAAALAGLGLDRDDIERVQLLTERHNGQSGSRHVTGYRAWVRLAGQPGHLVIALDSHCRIEQAYLEGGARLPDA